MTHHTGSVPDTLEPAGQWRKQAACFGYAKQMFPGTVPDEIENAKSICRRCPVINECLRWALAAREPSGVWGGMSEKERTSLLRQTARLNLTPAEIAARADTARRRRPPKAPRTLRSVFDEGTTRLHGGHLAWTGRTEIKIKGRKYSPKQLAFTLDRGTFPEGRVLVDCGVAECVLARHLTDQAERARWRTPAEASA
jgi:WhiB family redox-sensing transcriptional regulator